MLVIPSINVPNLETAKKRIEEAEKFLPQAGWLHFDIWEKSWGNPEEFKNFKTRLATEVHLMLSNLMTSDVISWLKAGASRIIVHTETASSEQIVETWRHEAKVRGVDLMVAVGPETPVEKLFDFPQIKYFQILAVTPGLSGQKFQPEVLEKIRALRANRPDALIEIDGGITPETAALAKSACADIIVSASYIFENPVLSPAEAYQKLCG